MPGTKLDLRTLTYVAYGLYALGFLSSGFLGIATLASVVLMYLKRADVAGTFYAAHFDWLLRTFWWALLWMAISALAVYLHRLDRPGRDGGLGLVPPDQGPAGAAGGNAPTHYA